MRHMTRDKVMFLCLCLFALSAAVAALNQETAILLLVASSGTFVLMGLVDNPRKERLMDSDLGRFLSRKDADGLREERER